MIKDIAHYLRILPYISVNVCAIIDYLDVTLLTRIGMSTSLVNKIQEIGRCARNVHNENPNVHLLMMSLDNFVFQIERTCDDNNNNNDNNDNSNTTNKSNNSNYEGIYVNSCSGACLTPLNIRFQQNKIM